MALSDLIVNLAGDATKFNKAKGQVEGGLTGLQGTVNKVAAGMKFGFGAMVGSLAPLSAALAGFSAIKTSIGLAADAEQTAIAFEVMTGSVENATALVGELREMGAKTPFEFTDLSKGAKTLLSFGRTQEQVLSDLDMLSNVASGDAQKLDSLAVVFGQIAANGKLMGGDLLQLINVGFNPLNEIAKKTGETMPQLRKRMEQGKIGLAEVEGAFRAATSQGGLFFQMNEKQSKTALGMWSTFKDNLGVIMTDIGQAIIEGFDFKGLLGEGSTFLEEWKDVLLPEIKGSIKELGKTFKDDVVPAIMSLVENLPTLISGFSKMVELSSDFVQFLKDSNKWIDQQAKRAAAAAKGVTLEEFERALVQEAADREVFRAKTGGVGSGFALEGHQAAIAKELKEAAEEMQKFNQWSDAWDGPFGEIDVSGVKGKTAKAITKKPLSSEDFKPNRSIEVGTQEAFEKIFATIGGPVDKKKPEKETAKNTSATALLLEDLFELGKRLEQRLEPPDPEVSYA